MATERRSPRMFKGALIGADPFNPVASFVVFDYNPSKLDRTLTPRQGSSDEGGKWPEIFRVHGPPEETIDLEIEINAYDQLERGERRAEELGVLPQLAAIEMLLYPKTANVLANTILKKIGAIEIIPLSTPMTIFVWGRNRVMPALVKSYRVTETHHDHNLNPIRAQVNLGLRVLTYDELPVWHPGGWLYMAHHVVKEALATLASIEDIETSYRNLGAAIDEARERR